MKLILYLLIAINFVYCGKCPPKEIMHPCECVNPSLDKSVSELCK